MTSKDSNYPNEGDSGKQITCLLVGAGSRGHNYSSYAIEFPKEFKVHVLARNRNMYLPTYSYYIYICQPGIVQQTISGS